MSALSGLREAERQIAAQESCASAAGRCYRDHDGCAVGESLRIVRDLIAGHPQCRGRIYREFPSHKLSWWRADCACGWSDLDITEWHYAMDAMAEHLGGAA